MERVQIITDVLAEIYPDAKCMLDYKEPYQLLIAGRLSAQCTDKRVNMVTAELFSRYPDVISLSAADITEVESIIRPCGLYKVKARDIIGICNILAGGKVPGALPKTIAELIKLPGIGRKTANLIIGDVFGRPSYVTDTHCIRIANRLGFTSNSRPERVETDLRKLIPPEDSTMLCHRLVLFGRDYCSARSPKCNRCPVIKKIAKTDPEFRCKLVRTKNG
ncbi:MAG: endonuclease III [Ruminococcus sp.]|jgi:endonuclease-3|nr:endonuclease III [Ruminococcus sp.]